MGASDVVIAVEAVSKLYRLGQVSTGTLAHDLNRWWHKIRGREDPYRKITPTSDEVNGRRVDNSNDRAPSSSIYALEDVSFKVSRGEILGIIGRNGAGKSTLLKILSRVTSPSSGAIRVRGRVASLLEVGTGFHPELTGRENIYLNGAILGMQRAEIRRKFDEIVGFSEVDKFIDTPVKRYSSGMYVRLAFAVAAHLQQEILIVDEVLAVGDVEFQKKCLGKMGDVAQSGRTVIFVSHNMAAVQNLCKRSISLHRGRVVMDGPTKDVIYQHLNADSDTRERRPDHLVRHTAAKANCRIIYFRVDTQSATDATIVQSGACVDLVFGVQSDIADQDMLLSWVIRDTSGQQLLLLHNKLEGTALRTMAGCAEVVCRIQALPLVADNYSVNAQLQINGEYVDNVDTEQFTIEAGDFFGTGMALERRNALFLIRGGWSQRTSMSQVSTR
jgi:lipopolysaccharide transport system ATP-binding protein